jgi:hypothetical protein
MCVLAIGKRGLAALRTTPNKMAGELASAELKRILRLHLATLSRSGSSDTSKKSGSADVGDGAAFEATTLCLCALSVSAAIFLVLDMYSPFRGVVRVSTARLQTALAQLGK